MKPLVITAATTKEITMLIDGLTSSVRLDLGHREVHEGVVAGRRVVVAETGIGKVNTAVVTARLLERYEPELLINTGCAGAYHGSGLQIGDLALATTEVYGDEGVLLEDGWQPLDLIGIPTVTRQGKQYFNKFPLSVLQAEKAARLAASKGVSLHRGDFVTVSNVSGSRERGDELMNRFGAICENMEGAATAQVALIYGIDCMELRGISNMVEKRDLRRWDMNRAVEQAQRFLLKFIEAYSNE
ncbi:MAG TPA: futalosine hydrolase [Geobacterales bacterium]|nr:futalosine hydrolase [Geobacterales bacterium]